MTDADRMVVWLRETMDAAQRDAEAACGRLWLDAEGDDGRTAWVLNEDMHLFETDPATARHAARHDPAAVLRQIDRHRKMLDLHTTPHTVVELAVDPVGELFCSECDGPCAHKGEAECAICGQDGCDTLRLLAEGWGWTEEEQR